MSDLIRTLFVNATEKTDIDEDLLKIIEGHICNNGSSTGDLLSSIIKLAESRAKDNSEDIEGTPHGKESAN